MKKRFQKIGMWKIVFSLLSMLLLLTNCQDNSEEEILTNASIKTVTEKEVSNLLSNMNQQSSKQKNSNSYVTYDIKNLTYEDISNTDAKLAVIPCKTKNKAEYSRILMLNIQGEYQTVVFNMFPSNKKMKTDLFDGEITIATLKGEMLRAFRVQEGEIISFYSSNTYASKNFDTNYTSAKGSDSSECREWCGHELSDAYCICNMQYLDEVMISGSTSTAYISISDLYGSDTGDHSGCEIDCDNTWNAVGGGTAINNNYADCPDGYEKDKNGNCVEKPCPGDPIKNPEIASQKGKSGTKGALFGCTRFGGNCTSGKDGRNKQHNGIDIKNSYGSPIYAMHDGFIYSTKHDDDGAGYFTRIQSTINGQTILTEYFHLQEQNRILQNTPGEPLVYVKAGDIIGYQGNSGNLADAIQKGIVDSHVHVEVRLHDGSSRWGYKNFTPIDPTEYFETTIDSNGISTKSNCN